MLFCYYGIVVVYVVLIFMLSTTLFMIRQISLTIDEREQLELWFSFGSLFIRTACWRQWVINRLWAPQFDNGPHALQNLNCNSTDTRAVPLMDHNAVVLFNNSLEGSDEEKVLVIALDVLPHPKSFHSQSTDINPYPFACKMDIPRRTLMVPLEEVTSLVFLEQLTALGR